MHASGRLVLGLCTCLSVAWKQPPDASSCASWCHFSDENCQLPFKRDQCQGCERCAEIRARESEAAEAQASCPKCPVCARCNATVCPACTTAAPTPSSSAELSRLKGSHESLKSEHGSVKSERDSLRVEASVLRTERDRLRVELDAAHAAVAAAERVSRLQCDSHDTGRGALPPRPAAAGAAAGEDDPTWLGWAWDPRHRTLALSVLAPCSLPLLILLCVCGTRSARRSAGGASPRRFDPYYGSRTMCGPAGAGRDAGRYLSIAAAPPIATAAWETQGLRNLD